MNHAAGSPFSATRRRHGPTPSAPGELVQGEIELRSRQGRRRLIMARETSVREIDPFFLPPTTFLELRFGIISFCIGAGSFSPDKRNKLFAKYAMRKLLHCIGENEILRRYLDKSALDSRVQRADGTIDNANTGKIRSY